MSVQLTLLQIKPLILTALLLLLAVATKRFSLVFPQAKFLKARAHIYGPNDDIKTLTRLKLKVATLDKYIEANDFNTAHCFLIDMSIASGTNRFFVYNLKKDSIEKTGLVTHGSGLELMKDSILFSNTIGSNCTSLGKYKIGKPYRGKFGLAYKLYGLEKTNSNAYSRFVVLHAHPCVPANEISPLEICRSWGCPTVSPAFLTQLKSYIDRSKQPLLLWIFQ